MKRLILLRAQAYSNAELAAMFDMDVKTFQRNIKGILPQLGKRIGRRWSHIQVDLILKHMDYTYTYISDVPPGPNVTQAA